MQRSDRVLLSTQLTVGLGRLLPDAGICVRFRRPNTCGELCNMHWAIEVMPCEHPNRFAETVDDDEVAEAKRREEAVRALKGPFLCRGG